MYNVLVTVKEFDDHIELASKEFDVDVSVKDLKSGLPVIKGMIERAGMRMKREGKELPEEFDGISGKLFGNVCIAVDFDSLMREKVTTTVRRTITLPEWVDLEVREKKIDASKLFREAFIEKYGETPEDVKILTVEELESRVDKKILKEYVGKYVKAALDFNEG